MKIKYMLYIPTLENRATASKINGIYISISINKENILSLYQNLNCLRYNIL